MKVLVTGGNGFIGSHLVMRLLKEEYSTTVIDYDIKFFNGYDKDKIHIFQLGAEDAKCERVFADNLFDIVVHLAYHSPAAEFNDNEMQQLYLNHVSLGNILCLSLKYHVRKVIVLTSYHVYGQQVDFPVSEGASLRSDDLIGGHQQTREQHCHEYRQKGLNVIILRTGCIYGPRLKAGPDNTIQQLIDDRFSGRPFVRQDTDSVILDYIYINDVIEAIYRATEREVSPILNISSGIGVSRQEIMALCRTIFIEQPETSLIGTVDQPDGFDSSKPAAELSFVLDNRLAQVELDWLPKYSLEEGIRKTLEWSAKSQNELVLNPVELKPVKAEKRVLNKNVLYTAETVALGGLAVLIAYLIKYRLNIDADILLLYVSMISLFYGIKQGSVAIVLAIAARVWLLLSVEGQQMIMLVNNVSTIMQLTLYLILGILIGYAIDTRIHQKETINYDLSRVRRELDFVNILYQKSLDVKNTLQSTIENSSNSLGKLIHLISSLERVEHDQVYNEVARIFADILKASHIHVFCTDSAGQWLRLISSVGSVKYAKSIQTSQFEFLNSVIKDHNLFINRDLVSEYPLVCAPICLGDQIEAVVFIDGIEFINLTQHFINTLKALTVLVSESIERKVRYEGVVRNEKYFDNTYILKRQWFEKSIHEKTESSQHRILLLKINNEIHNYRNFNRIVNNLIRSVDSVGEIARGQLGIILIDTDRKYLPIIQARFSEKGFSIDLMETEVL